ncbi:MAG TPA: VWA domain-containing protein [Bryobacteraceae bacterium]|nr:VWA domain-containing protein [Bryobacteraceae bacterium]
MSIHRLHYLLAAIAAVATHAQDRKPAQEVPEVRISAKPYVPASVALRVGTDLVEVGVVVRNHDGHAISGLKQEDFAVTDQGSSRELTYFSIETPGAVRGSPQTANLPSAAATKQLAVVTTQPRFIALYFEDFGTNSGDLKRAQVAGRRFVSEGLDDSDRVAIFSTSGDFLDYTGDKAKLIAAIDKLRSHPKFSEAGLGGCPRISPFQAYQIIVMSDPAALEAASKEAEKCASAPPDDSGYGGATVRNVEGHGILSQAEITWGQVRVASQATLDAMGRAMRSLQAMPGRRLFLLVSSGFTSSTLEIERDHLISQALRAGIVVNSIDAKGLYTNVPGRDSNEEANIVGPLPDQTFRFETSSAGVSSFANNQVMSDLAQATGGLFFHNNNDLPYGFRALGSIPEVSYVLGFSRRDTAADGKYHKLKVTLRESKPYVIQARPGYFATPAATPVQDEALERQRALDREVNGGSMLADFPTSLAFRLDAAQAQGMVTVKAQIHVALDKLRFPIRNDRRVQQLKLVVVLLDGNGNIAAAKEGTMDFAMADATYGRLLANGINAGLNLDVHPGRYRLRAVVQEAVDGKMATSSLNIEAK